MIRSVTLDTTDVMSLLGALRRDRQVYTDWKPPTGEKTKKNYGPEMRAAEIFVRDDRILYGILQAFDDRRIESVTITPNIRRSNAEE